MIGYPEQIYLELLRIFRKFANIHSLNYGVSNHCYTVIDRIVGVLNQEVIQNVLWKLVPIAARR